MVGFGFGFLGLCERTRYACLLESWAVFCRPLSTISFRRFLFIAWLQTVLTSLIFRCLRRQRAPWRVSVFLFSEKLGIFCSRAGFAFSSPPGSDLSFQGFLQRPAPRLLDRRFLGRVTFSGLRLGCRLWCIRPGSGWPFFFELRFVVISSMFLGFTGPFAGVAAVCLQQIRFLNPTVFGFFSSSSLFSTDLTQHYRKRSPSSQPCFYRSLLNLRRRGLGPRRLGISFFMTVVGFCRFFSASFTSLTGFGLLFRSYRSPTERLPLYVKAWPKHSSPFPSSSRAHER